MKKKLKGFTLVELIVVIAIIGVLAAILVPSLSGYVKKSRLQAANSSAKTAYNAVATYVTDQEVAGTPVKTSEGGDFDATATSPAAGIHKVICDALSDNGSGAGHVNVKFISGSSDVADGIDFVQWSKAGSGDSIIGQYPDGPATPDEKVTWGTKYTPGATPSTP